MRLMILMLMLIVMPAFAAAQDVSVLSQRGAVLFMRHALAPGTGDPAKFTLGTCSTQRNLSAVGRGQARRVGRAVRDAGLLHSHVSTSQWCRCADTARLLNLGEVTSVPALNSHFAGRGNREAQWRAVLDMLGALPKGARPLLVTHQINIVR